MLPASANLYAHQPQDEIVDEEIYTMVDSFVSDTPPVIQAFDETGDGMTETSITADSLSMFEALAARGDLHEYVEMLKGVVDTSISFNDNGSVTMTVSHVR